MFVNILIFSFFYFIIVWYSDVQIFNIKNMDNRMSYSISNNEVVSLKNSLMTLVKKKNCKILHN